MTNEDWAKSVTRRVAAEIKRRRGKHTVQWVSDRTAELGYTVSRSRISDLEAGKRGGPIGVAELIVIAEALDIPPVELLYGASLMTGETEYLPGKSTTGWDALRRFTGEDSDVERPDPNDRGYSLALMRDLGRRAARYTKTVNQYRELSAVADLTRARLTVPGLDDETRQAGEAELARLTSLTDQMREHLEAARDVEALTRATLENKGFQVDPMIEEQP